MTSSRVFVIFTLTAVGCAHRTPAPPSPESIVHAPDRTEAELLARDVGSTGVVYGQNARSQVQTRYDKPWSERLSRPVNGNVVRVDREFVTRCRPRRASSTSW